mmetsp:Transcript_28650/g.38197  ORF Transcript_28650/g.38197 Transcript_28650/m.38197 type:complete len:93 (+) Transcript_28650:633-911(+)
MPVHKHPMPHNVDMRKLRQVIDKMANITLRQEKCIDVIVHFLDDLTKVCGYTKATLYALDPLMQTTFKKAATKDKMKYCNMIGYKDQMTSST